MHLSLFKGYNNTYHSAVQGVDERREKLFRNNLSGLAAAKTATVVNQLIEAKTQYKNREEYLLKAKRIVNTYAHYTATEYNTMVHRVRVAKQMEQFQTERHMYPNIEWLPSRAAEPDLVHRGYWYHVWAHDDPFWQSNFPGCRWGCKCSWRTTDAPVTDKSRLKLVPPSPGLEGNPYHTNQIVSKNHPYYHGVERHIPKLGVLHNPDEVVYIPHPIDNGKTIQVHYLVMQEHEFDINMRFAKILAANGFNNIKLLPQIHYSETQLRQRYFGKAYAQQHPTKNPDAWVDGVLMEFKKFNKNYFVSKVLKSLKQSSVVVIMVDDMTLEDIYNKLESIQKLNKLKQIMIIHNDILYDFKRP